ncbi:MAG: NAD-dependent epimerase/dehydratase family protein [Candidatus Caldarchaeales archaeon]
MRVLVTGSEGFVGRHVVAYLGERGHEVAGLDVRGSRPVDVTSFDQVLRAFEEFRPEAVVHLAAIANVVRCIEDPRSCFEANVLGTLNVVEAAHRFRVERFVYASSANVYGQSPRTPVTESEPLRPRTPYDHTKVAAESVVMSYVSSKSLPAVVFRSWKLFGEGEPETSVTTRFVDACLRGDPIPLHNGGRDVTDPYHVENYCRAVELALKSDGAVGEAFNLGTGNRVSIRELALVIRRLTGSSSELLDLPPRTQQESEPMVSYPSIEKARRVLGYEPVVGLEEGLRRLIAWREGRVPRRPP